MLPFPSAVREETLLFTPIKCGRNSFDKGGNPFVFGGGDFRPSLCGDEREGRLLVAEWLGRGCYRVASSNTDASEDPLSEGSNAVVATRSRGMECQLVFPEAIVNNPRVALEQSTHLRLGLPPSSCSSEHGQKDFLFPYLPSNQKP
ncbi:hypothetical protein TNCV_516551 [Trichonephila clavipes]|nr:hypothetical protein TNCV_516551 [Trichonephila clavipes]